MRIASWCPCVIPLGWAGGVALLMNTCRLREAWTLAETMWWVGLEPGQGTAAAV
jgi:hypothetical protein